MSQECFTPQGLKESRAAALEESRKFVPTSNRGRQLNPNILDHYKEMEIFYTHLDHMVAQCSDPKKVQRMKIAIQQFKKEKRGRPFDLGYEVQAENAWSMITSLMEEDERSNLTYDGNILEQIGIPEALRLNIDSGPKTWDREDEKVFKKGDIIYELSSPQGFKYFLVFEKGGCIRLHLNHWIHKESTRLGFSYSAKQVVRNLHISQFSEGPIFRHVSLQDLRQPQTFNIEHIPPKTDDLEHVFALLGHSINAPIDSDNPAVQKKIQLKKQLHNQYEKGYPKGVTPEDIKICNNFIAQTLAVLIKENAKEKIQKLVYETLHGHYPQGLLHIIDHHPEIATSPLFYKPVEQYAKSNGDPIILRAIQKVKKRFRQTKYQFLYTNPQWQGLPADTRDTLGRFAEQSIITSENFPQITPFLSPELVQGYQTVSALHPINIVPFAQAFDTLKNNSANTKLLLFLLIEEGGGELEKIKKFLLDIKQAPDEIQSAMSHLYTYTDLAQLRNVAVIASNSPFIKNHAHKISTVITREYFDPSQNKRVTNARMNSAATLLLCQKLQDPDVQKKWDMISGGLQALDSVDESDVKRIIYRSRHLDSSVFPKKNEWHTPPGQKAFFEKFSNINLREIKAINNLPEKARQTLWICLESLEYAIDDPQEAYDLIILTRDIQHPSQLYLLRRYFSDADHHTRYQNMIEILQDIAAYSLEFWSQISFQEKRSFISDKAKFFLYLLHKKIPEATILQHREFLSGKTNRTSQDMVFVFLEQGSEHAERSIGIFENCEGCQRIWKKNENNFLKKFAITSNSPEETAELANIIADFGNISFSLLSKSPTKESLKNAKKIQSENFNTKIEALIKNPKERELLERAMRWFATTQDLQDLENLIQRCENFLENVRTTNYQANKDPEGEKLQILFFNHEHVLSEESNDPFYLSFVLNVLVGQKVTWQGEEVVLSEEKLNIIAREEWDQAQEQATRRKWGMILIGLGRNTNEFTPTEIRHLAQCCADRYTTRYEISKAITDEQLQEIRDKEISLSLYFSMLSALREERQAAKNQNNWEAKKDSDKTVNIDGFRRKVALYEDIKNQPMLIGQTLALFHSEGDSNDSNLSDDIWNADHYKALVQDPQKFTVLRYGQERNGGRDDLESMFTYLRSRLPKDEETTILIGGHGNKNIISFGDEEFQMTGEGRNNLFSTLKARANGNPDQSMQVIFKSCHSDDNVKLLLKQWAEDPITQNIPIKLGAESSESNSSAKMTSDALIRWSQKVKQGMPATWGNFYHQVEARNYVLSDINSGRNWFNRSGLNSNFSLWIYDPKTKKAEKMG